MTMEGFNLSKKAVAFFDKGLHGDCSDAATMRSVISDTHVTGNNEFNFFPPCGAGTLRSFFTS